MARVNLPDWPWQIVRRLADAHGQRLWLVGGAVRDALLGRALRDWDFAVDHGVLGLARAVADALNGAYYPLDVERETGRVLARAPDGVRQVLDFALLRGPDLEVDLAGRDFTVNALALDTEGRLIDPTGGMGDLSGCLIRATTDRVFQDDPVRLLRALRLQGELGFSIEPGTADLICRDAALITHPSPERIRDELLRLVEIRGAAESLRRTEGFGLISPVVPELGAIQGVTQSLPHRFDVWTHTLHVVDVLDGVLGMIKGQEVGSLVLADVPGPAWRDLSRVLGLFHDDLLAYLAVEVGSGHDREILLRLAALLHDVGKAETWSKDDEGAIHFYGHEEAGARLAAGRLHELRFARSEQAFVSAVIQGHMRLPQLADAERVTRRAVYRYYRDLDDAGAAAVLLSLADHLATWGPDLVAARWLRRLQAAETLLSHYFDGYADTISPCPLVSGTDLMAELGLSAGPLIGELLDAVREAQAAGEVTTREEALAYVARAARGASAT